MNPELALHVGRRALEMTLLLSAPVLVVTVVVGFLTAMLQAVTSIRDMTMGMILKLAAIGGTLVFTGSWMIQTAVAFTRDTFNMLQTMAR